MPDQNNQNPDQSQQQNGLGTVPMAPQSDIPPLPTDFSSAPATPPVATTPEPLITTTPVTGEEPGSAAPPAPAFSDITAPPKKKFGGGKIIATILGIFVLVGGVAAAVLTINQKQLFQQKAACLIEPGYSCATNADCKSTEYCYKPATGCPVCKPQGCTPNSKYCSDTKTLKVCTSSGSGYISTVCPDLCANGTCITGSSCDNCTLGSTKACTASGGGAGTQTCVNSEYCAGKANAGNWGGCIATSTNTAYCVSNSNCPTDYICYKQNSDQGTCIKNTATSGETSGGTNGGSSGSTTTTTSTWPKQDGTISCTNTSGTVRGCVLYLCPNGCSGGCGESNPGVYLQNYISTDGCEQAEKALANQCGQVDTVNESGIYCMGAGQKNAKIWCNEQGCTAPPPKTAAPTPTTPSVAPFCAAISTYDSDWNLLSSTDRSSLKAGDTINLCVTGSAATGTFDMARFIINGVQQTDTTATRPNSTDFCQSYTLPEGTATFTVSAQIHHSSGVWY